MGQKESDALTQQGNILCPHKTCKVEDWLLFSHPEDYQTGKYFFFELPDVLKFAKETYGSRKPCSLLEIDVDEKDIYPNIGYGVYCYPDYENNGSWNNNLSHAIPEVFLPYSVVADAIADKKFKTISIDNKSLLNFHSLYNKDRNPKLVELGKTLCHLCISKKHASFYSPDNADYIGMNGIFRTSRYEESLAEVAKYEPLFEALYKEFIDGHRQYSEELGDYINLDNMCDADFNM